MGFSGFSVQVKKPKDNVLAKHGGKLTGLSTSKDLFKSQEKTESEMYNPFEPTSEPVEAQSKPQKKTRRKKKSRWDTDEAPRKILPDSPPPYLRTSDDEEEDELDKYMAGIENDLEKEELGDVASDLKDTKAKGKRFDIDDEDDQESYFNAVKDGLIVPYPDDDELWDYDSDGNPIPPEKSKIIEPLPPIDHSEIQYADFDSNFYEEHPDIAALPRSQVDTLRNKLGIKVSGAGPARPAISFAHFGFDIHLMSAIRRSEYSQPTPIQAQAVPVALSGRDIIGIAKTGSGKTAAFIWPMLVHIMAQGELKDGDGPIGLICAPTRELCQQIHMEAKKFGKCYNLRSVAVYGGGNKWEQSKALQQGAEIVVATPGRLIDLIKAKATNFERVTYLVFDEADRMFDMGFEPQVRSIANHVRPDRQCLLFSATMKKKIERLCRDILTDPIRIVIGEIGEANEDVLQVVEILQTQLQKWNWLLSHIVEFCSGGSVLIFVTKKTNSEELAKNLREKGHELGLIHGDFDQFERNKVLSEFKRGDYSILVATDVAARGLDITSIKTVINYDVARDITTHTHRVGRTGRAGEKGIAYTLVTPTDQNFTGDLVRNLEGANQQVPDQLMELAMKNAWFRKARARQKNKIANKEFKPRDRPGLGHPGIQDAIAQIDNTPLDEDEEADDLGSGFGPPKRKTTKSLLTSYAAASSLGSSRLSNIKSAFATGYGRFTKASSNVANTMDVGQHATDVQSQMPVAMSTFQKPEPPKAKKSKWSH